MLGFSRKKELVSACPPPAGIAELVLCIFDEKGRLRHHLKSAVENEASADRFSFISPPESPIENRLVQEAFATKKPVSITLSFGAGERTFLYVIPYERKKNRWSFICMQVTTDAPAPDRLGAVLSCALSEERMGLLLTDNQGVIFSSSSRIPEPYGFAPGNLIGKHLSDLFEPGDLKMISSCSPDTNESIQSCILRCLDGSKRDVDVIKYSLPDHLFLYGISDVKRSDFKEEVTQASTRERKRIGQDLHDSIGQMLTGISLLSRSLANSLKRGGHPGDEDALQISELADDASNQIRQISRGLMATEIIQRGLCVSLQDLARITTESCGLQCVTVFDETVEFADGAVETHLFRIAQEAVNNAVRHANATCIELLINSVNGMPQLEIRDNGVWKECIDRSGGIGMKTMHYRASAIGGQLSVGPGEQGGTHVVCLLELDESLETRV